MKKLSRGENVYHMILTYQTNSPSRMCMYVCIHVCAFARSKMPLFLPLACSYSHSHLFIHFVRNDTSIAHQFMFDVFFPLTRFTCFIHTYIYWHAFVSSAWNNVTYMQRASARICCDILACCYTYAKIKTP
jgi:hypothetical protein